MPAHPIPPLDAATGDRFVFVAEDTGARFQGQVLARERTLVQVRWQDGHTSWTPLTVERGTVEVTRNA